MLSITDDSGTIITQQRFLPFGGMRQLANYQTSGLTDYTYTGQRTLDSGMGGLMDYKARFYSPVLGHFIQPDSLIPDATNPQAWNRFSYVANRPINFNDPTGHMMTDDSREGGKCNLKCLENLHSYNKVPLGDAGGKLNADDWENASTYNTIYVGGATPADLPGFMTDGPEGVYGWGRLPEVVDEFIGLTQMYQAGYGGYPPTLIIYLGYYINPRGTVTQIDFEIRNFGATTTTFDYLRVSQIPLPLTETTCRINTNCVFKPNGIVDIAPGQTTKIGVCDSCLADNNTIFTTNFTNNRNDAIELTLGVLMLFESQHETSFLSLPFMYTIPPR